MKFLVSLFAILLLLVSPGSASTQQATTWETYTSTTLKIEIRYPSQWKVGEVDADYVTFSPSPRNEWAHGVGLPPNPNPWFEIHRASRGNCVDVRQLQDFQPDRVMDNEPTTSYQQRTVCRGDGIVLSFGYWESDAHKLKTRETLNSMLASFKTVQQASIERVSTQVVRVLHDRDMNKLAGFVHPTKGVRFSPYEFVESSHRVMTTAQIRSRDKTTYVWGNYDGSGYSIRLTFDAYYRQFVNDRDYTRAPRITRNGVVGGGNTINNIREFYPQSVWVEYHFPSTDQRNDWNSLWLVFEEYNGGWYLIGVVHGEWTI